MRIPNAAHESRAWRIRELTRDFRLEDVWELPTPGGPDDFPRLVQGFASGDPSQNPSGAVYVKPNGFLGAVYMAAIRPFRHLIVYRPLLREIGRTWRQGALP